MNGPELMNTPLTDDEFDYLAGILATFPDAMSIEKIDGFFAALICSPDMVMPSEYLPYVLGESYRFESLEEAERIPGLLLRHWNSIVAVLLEGDEYPPLLNNGDDDTYGHEWAVGFIEGMGLSGDAWDLFFVDEDESDLFLPIFALAYADEPEFKQAMGAIDQERRAVLLDGVALMLPEIYHQSAIARSGNYSEHEDSETFRREGRKIGRNEPCPCGSGKKYKKCCGLH